MRTLPNKMIPDVTKKLFVALLILPMVLTACGFRGPLYLPGETPAEPATESSAPQTGGLQTDGQAPAVGEVTGNLPAEDEGEEDDGRSDA